MFRKMCNAKATTTIIPESVTGNARTEKGKMLYLLSNLVLSLLRLDRGSDSRKRCGCRGSPTCLTCPTKTLAYVCACARTLEILCWTGRLGWTKGLQYWVTAVQPLKYKVGQVRHSTISTIKNVGTSSINDMKWWRTRAFDSGWIIERLTDRATQGIVFRGRYGN